MQRKINKSYSISFYSHNLTNIGKLDTLKQKAIIIRDALNKLSPVVASDIVNNLKLSKHKFATKYYSYKPDDLSANEWQRALFNMYTAYSNKFSAIENKLKVFLYETKIDYYKNNSRFGVKGSVKSILQKEIKTDLTRCVSWMLNNEVTSIERLNEIIKWMEINSNENAISTIRIYHEKVIKYGDRLFNLVKNIKSRILQKYSSPIEFNSLTYSNYNQFKERLVVKRDWKNKYKSQNDDFNAYFMIACANFNKLKDRIAIPIKYSRKYHGNYAFFNKQDIVYNIIFEEDNDRVRLTVTREKESVENYDCENITGIDLNTKNNLLMNEYIEVDYDRNKVKKIISYKKTVEKDNISKEERIKLKHLNLSLEMDIKKRISKAANELLDKGINHVVIEDISSFGKSFIRLDWMEGVKTNTLGSILKLGTIKKYIISIFERKGIQVTITKAAYTSQECSKCHYIDRGNRLTQETFKCMVCSHAINADLNASINIKNRLASDVLRKALFNSSNGRYIMKPLSRPNIKSILNELHVKTIENHSI